MERLYTLEEVILAW